MKLEEITSPFITKRCIAYGKGQNKSLYHHRKVQLIKGNIYRGETLRGYPINKCDIYALYNDAPVGVWMGRVRVDCTIDEVLGCMQQKHCLTLEDYLSNVREKLHGPAHFMLVEMEFMNHVAPNLKESMRKARQAYHIQGCRDAEIRRQRRAKNEEEVRQ